MLKVKNSDYEFNQIWLSIENELLKISLEPECD